MTSTLVKELTELFYGPDNPFLDPEKEGKLCKLAIKHDIDKGLPNGPYFVNGVEVTMDNIDSFSYRQLSQSSAEHIEKIISDPNHAISFLW